MEIKRDSIIYMAALGIHKLLYYLRCWVFGKCCNNFLLLVFPITGGFFTFVVLGGGQEESKQSRFLFLGKSVSSNFIRIRVKGW